MALSENAWAVLATLLVGCATPPTRPIQFQIETGENAPVPAARDSHSACALYMKAITDARSPNEQVVLLGTYRVFTESVPRWVRDGVASLNKMGHRVVFAEEQTRPMPSDVILSLTIRKAYVQPDISKSANLVVSVEYQHRDKLESRVYRGHDASINWSSSADEFESAMNRALTRVLTEISNESRRLCSSSSPQTTAVDNNASNDRAGPGTVGTMQPAAGKN